MNVSRREMLKLSAATTAAWATGLPSLGRAADSSNKKIPIGLQLYSVRGDCQKDLPGVLKAVGKMGYDGVEFAGYYGYEAKEIRQLMDDNGLKCCGTHAALDTLTGDALPDTIKFNKILGNKYLIVPWIPHERFETKEKAITTARLLTELAEKAKPHGMRVGYHAHGGDFVKLGDSTPWEVLFTHAGPNVVMQMDMGNCLGGGGDPIAILKKFPGRSVTIHLKEHGGKQGAVVGEGDVDWKAVFEICETTGKTEWYIVEQEGYAGTPLDCVAACIKNLREMGK